MENRKNVQASLFKPCDILRGKVFYEKNIIFKRSSEGTLIKSDIKDLERSVLG